MKNRYNIRAEAVSHDRKESQTIVFNVYAKSSLYMEKCSLKLLFVSIFYHYLLHPVLVVMI